MSGSRFARPRWTHWEGLEGARADELCRRPGALKMQARLSARRRCLQPVPGPLQPVAAWLVHRARAAMLPGSSLRLPAIKP